MRNSPSSSSRSRLAIALASLIFVALVITIQYFQLSSHETQQPFDMVVFEAKRAGFTIRFPENWTAMETPQGAHGDQEIVAVLLPAGRSFPQLYVARNTFSNPNMDAVASWGESRAKLRNGYQEFSLFKLNTDYHTGLARDYSWENPTIFGLKVIRCKDWYVLKESIGYDLSFCADQVDWSRYEPVFEKMIESFQIG